MGATITWLRDDAIGKSGTRVRRHKEVALRLVKKHTDVPVPEVFLSGYTQDSGRLSMSVIAGSPLNLHWGNFDEQTKERLCCEIWNLIGKFRQIPKPPEFDDFFPC